MSIVIGATTFDSYEGRVQVAKKKVRQHTSTVHAGGAAQVLPTSPEQFELETVFYSAIDTSEASAATFEALIGTLLNIVTTINYSSAKSTQFLVVDVMTLGIDRLVRARGKRGASVIDISPADMIRTKWTLLAVPT